MKGTLNIGMLLISSTASACPFCSTKTAAEIRASLFGPDFFFNLGMTILPFIIFSAIVFLIHRGGFKSSSKNK